MKKTITTALTLALTLSAWAQQSGTSSPYSQYGLGTLAEPVGGQSRSLAGLSYGLHEHNQVNFNNPASYAAIDSLTFLFDAGFSIHTTNFDETAGGKRHRSNYNDADFDYAIAAFKVARHVGVSFGFVPFSTIGYEYSNTSNVNAFSNPTSANTTYSNSYTGSGGLREAYVGAGWQPMKYFSVGANIGYIWGDYTRTVTNTYSDAYVNTLSKQYYAQLASYKLDLGAQLYLPINRDNDLTVGLAYSLGHEMSGTPECINAITNSQTSSASYADTIQSNGHISLPHTFGLGVLWNHKSQLKVGLDYQLQKWGSVDWPSLSASQKTYNLTSGQFTDRHKFTLGGEYCKGERYRGFFQRLHYRAGISYATPYLKINGQDGPRELSATLGLGIPIVNNYNNRSVLNISAQWSNRSADGMLKENCFRINVGLTFNERWFAKFKVE